MFRLFRKSYLFLVVLVPYLVSMMGVTAFYFGYQYRHSFQELIRSSDKEDLDVLKFSEAEFESIEWTEEDNREFTYHGKMYDVSRIEKTNGVFSVYCEQDAFEDALIAWMKVNGEKSKSKSNPIVQFFQVTAVFHFQPSLSELQKTGTQSYCFYTSYEGEIVTPPPRAL
jgi:hypothetical protein